MSIDVVVRPSSRFSPLGVVAMTLLSIVVLAGCKQPVDTAQEDVRSTAVDAPAETPVVPQEESTAMVGETIGGDGSAIQLDALSERDLAEADLGGELACAFSVGDAAPILLARGVVASDEPARGIVKVSGYVEPVRAPGGFDGMLKNPVFTGQGKTLRISETEKAIGGGESPPIPASLTYERADGASRRFDGHWQCGPEPERMTRPTCFADRGGAPSARSRVLSP